MSINSRYQVGHDDWGSLEHVADRQAAIACAKNYSDKYPNEEIWVFDRMAHKGNINLFTLYGGVVVKNEIV